MAAGPEPVDDLGQRGSVQRPSLIRSKIRCDVSSGRRPGINGSRPPGGGSRPFALRAGGRRSSASRTMGGCRPRPTADPSARRRATTPPISIRGDRGRRRRRGHPVPARTGTARAALSHRTFRIVFLGAFASNIGTWMQNVVLGAYAYDLTHSATFVGVIIFAQLGPTLVLPMVGGLLADKIDRKRFLIILSIEQLVFSLGVALVAASPHPSHVLLVIMVLGVGAGSAMFGPAYSAVLPGLVGKQDLPGAISLNSAQMNASRVIGPVIGGLLYSLVGPAWIFAGNAATYLFVVAALMMVTLPAVPQTPTARQPLAPADGRHHGGPRGQGGGPVPGHGVRVLAAGAGLHRADAGGGRPQPRHRPLEVGGLRHPVRLLRHRAPSPAPSPSGRSSPRRPSPCSCGSASSATRWRCAPSRCSGARCRRTCAWP